MIKFITYYLPQFHIIPENNEWWGEGFTEWERLKNAKPLFPGHKQPRIPYIYYDLSDIEILKKQTDVAKNFGLDGFCYYHYWFNGKKLLEKPLEQMLIRKDINMPFCLSWANEPWTKAWAGKSKEVIMPQKYGEESDWLMHLEYLIQFFIDDRYIKIGGKPIFVIYRTESFNRFDEMISFWQKKLISFGFNGLYIVETLNSFQKKPKLVNSSAVIEFEPMFSIRKKSNKYLNSLISKVDKIFRKTSYKLVDYDIIWRRIIKRNNNYGKTRFLGAFVDWDNSPRFGEKGTIFVGASPDKFQKYLLEQTKKSEPESYIFINAWNEWAEGAYLEPDNYNGNGYLESISNIKKIKLNNEKY